MGEKARVLRKKIQEGIENAQVAQITGAVIDELLRESLAQQVPEIWTLRELQIRKDE
ncbi:hypothetical protein [Klebsiella pneumoniae]|uniref:hypothetical protein n=1 Tax=Klebsiella pneumoniae TaxID=573 RepID=UPI0040554129